MLLLVVVLGRDWQGRLAAELVTWWSFAIAGLIGLWYAGWLKPAFQRVVGAGHRRVRCPARSPTRSARSSSSKRALLLLTDPRERGGNWRVHGRVFSSRRVVELAAVSLNSAYAPWLYRQLAAPDEGTRDRLVALTYRQFATAAGLALIGRPRHAGGWLPTCSTRPSRPRGGYVVWLADRLLLQRAVLHGHELHLLRASDEVAGGRDDRRGRDPRPARGHPDLASMAASGRRRPCALSLALSLRPDMAGQQPGVPDARGYAPSAEGPSARRMAY